MSYLLKISLPLILVGLAGCSETAFQDAFDTGKFSPDETQVRTNKSLTVPPDLQLRAPTNAPSGEQRTANNAPPQVSTQPPQYGQAPYQPGTAPQAAYTPPAGQQPGTQPPAGQRPPQGSTYMQNIYRKWGVSEYRPDGTKKSEDELLRELRAKKLARQRAKNKNYGTIFNLPNIFKDE